MENIRGQRDHIEKMFRNIECQLLANLLVVEINLISRLDDDNNKRLC